MLWIVDSAKTTLTATPTTAPYTNTIYLRETIVGELAFTIDHGLNLEVTQSSGSTIDCMGMDIDSTVGCVFALLKFYQLSNELK